MWTAIGTSLGAVFGGLLLRRPVEMEPPRPLAPEPPSAARRPTSNVLPPAIPPKPYEMEPAAVVALLSSVTIALVVPGVLLLA